VKNLEEVKNQLLNLYKEVNYNKNSDFHKIFTEIKLNAPLKTSEIKMHQYNKRTFFNYLKILKINKYIIEIPKKEGFVNINNEKKELENKYFFFSSFKKWWNKDKRTAEYTATPYTALMHLKLSLILYDSASLPNIKAPDIIKDILAAFQTWEVSVNSQQNELFSEEVIRNKHRENFENLSGDELLIAVENLPKKIQDEINFNKSNKRRFKEMSNFNYLKEIMKTRCLTDNNNKTLSKEKCLEFLDLIKASPEMLFVLTMHNEKTLDFHNIQELLMPLLNKLITLFRITGNLDRSSDLIKQVNKETKFNL